MMMIRVDTKLKKSFEVMCKDLDITVNTAVNLMVISALEKTELPTEYIEEYIKSLEGELGSENEMLPGQISFLDLGY